MIHVRIDSDQIRVAFRYNPEYVKRVKIIPYRKYDPETKTWLIPKPQWRNFVKIFRDVAIQIPKEQTEEFSLLDRPEDFPPISQVKGFKGTLYPFQTRGVGFLVARKRCLLADPMGLGKTIMAVAAALELRNRGQIKRCLVFCPKTIIMQWLEEYYRFTGDGAVAVIGNKKQRRLICETFSHKFFGVTNYETVLRDAELLASTQPDLVILDEAQRIKNYRAKTTKQIKKHFSPEYRWALTGTPLENKLQELHSIMDWVDPGILGPWWSFRDKHLIVKERRVIRRGRRGREVRRFRQVVGYRNLRELHEQLRGWMLRRTKSEVLADLPPVTVNNYYIQLNREERAVYNLIRSRLEEYYLLYKRRRGSSRDVLAQLVFLRECCDHLALVSDKEDSSKLDELTNILEDLYQEKVVVFTEFERFLQKMADRLQEHRVEHVKLYGAMNQQQRVASINTFNSDPDCRVFLSTEAGGLGVNLQAASILINVDLHWNPARLQQRIGRLHRIGQKNTVTCINLVAEDTIEERVLKVIRDKTGLFRRVVYGDFSGASYENAVWRILEEEFGGERKRWI